MGAWEEAEAAGEVEDAAGVVGDVALHFAEARAEYLQDGEGEGQGQEGRQEMESTLTFSMLGVRVAEMKGAWMENRNDLVAGLLQVEESLGVWLEVATALAGQAD